MKERNKTVTPLTNPNFRSLMERSPPWTLGTWLP